MKINKQGKNKSALRRTCILGLGGTGQHVVSRVLDWLDTDLTVSARVYDTDILTKRVEQLHPIFIKADVDRAEKIRTNPQAYPKFANIFRLERIKPITNMEGTGQFLSQGELLFAASLTRVINHIQAAVKPLLSGNLPTQVREAGHELADNRIYFIIVRSMAGGTGSGAGQLLTHLVKRELINLTQNPRRIVLIDMVILPEVYESSAHDKYKIFANAAGFLHMLSEYSRSDKPPVTFEFGDEPHEILEVGGKPAADLTFLIGNNNLSGERGASVLSSNDVFDICARYIKLNVNSAVMSRYYATFADIQHEVNTFVGNQPTVISGLGYNELLFDARRSYQWLINKTARKIVSRMRGGYYE